MQIIRVTTYGPEYGHSAIVWEGNPGYHVRIASEGANVLQTNSEALFSSFLRKRPQIQKSLHWNYPTPHCFRWENCLNKTPADEQDIFRRNWSSNDIN